MKEYFKYDNGYININEENVFLTNSGNWSETHELQEKSPKSIRKSSLKGMKFYIFFFLLFGGFLLSIIFEEGKKRIIPIGFIALVILVYKYFSKEMGKAYKIPLHKLKAIQINGKEVKFIFLNLKGDEDSETIQGVEEKGLLFLSGLKKTIANE